MGPLVGTEERKMVTVVFADIVDSTGLGRRLDAERAREVLGQFFGAAAEELLALRGHPEKFIGDAVMAVFGLPAVHEDDALRAVRAGLAIRARARRLGQAAGLAEPLEVRIGIESGEAAMGRNPSGQVLVTGPVVNVAARLQSSAQPGQLLAGRTTHADICTSLEMFAREVMPEFHAREPEHQRWKADVLAGRVELPELDTDTYKIYAHQNEDIVRLTPEELKAKMAAKEGRG